MLRPPPLRSLPRYPISGGVALLAIVVTGLTRSAYDIPQLYLTDAWWRGEPWRLVTSALPHGGILHLIFNLYWLWVFGTFVEQRFGEMKTLGMILLLAAGSGAAEFAFLRGGIGLSGVVYGLFGFLWVLTRRDQRYRNVIDEHTRRLFVGWFFLCIVLTLLRILLVANIAHGVGAILGAMLGEAIVGRRPRRRLVKAALVASLVGLGLLASVARPYVNLFGYDHAEEEAVEVSASDHRELGYAGYQALQANQNERAVRLLQQAVVLHTSNAGYWHNLGIALARLERLEEAAEAYEKAHALKPNYRHTRNALAAVRLALAMKALEAGKADEAVSLCREALDVSQTNAETWRVLGAAYQKLGRSDDAVAAFEKAEALSNQPTAND